MVHDMNDIIVTREMLVADKACDPAMEAFDVAFPGGSATLQEIVEHPRCRPYWLGWLAVNASFVTAETGPGMIDKSGSPKDYAFISIDYAKWMTPKIKAELIAKYGD